MRNISFNLPLSYISSFPISSSTISFTTELSAEYKRTQKEAANKLRKDISIVQLSERHPFDGNHFYNYKQTLGFARTSLERAELRLQSSIDTKDEEKSSEYLDNAISYLAQVPLAIEGAAKELKLYLENVDLNPQDKASCEQALIDMDDYKARALEIQKKFPCIASWNF